MAERNWNPMEPSVLGLEWPGMRNMTVPLSQDVEYGHTFESSANQTVDTAEFQIVEPEVSPLSVSTALVTVYERGDETVVGVPTSTIRAVNGGALGGAASLVVGATITDCLASSADDAYVSIPDNGADEVRLEFSTAGLFTGKRILEVRLRYVASRITDVEGDVPALKLIVNDTAIANIGIVGHVPVDAYGASSSPLRVVSLGECNYAIAGSDVWPYTVGDVQNFDTTNLQVRLQASSLSAAGTTALHYAALEVVWCEENRVAVGGTMLRQGKDAPTVGTHDVHLRTPAGVDNWSKAVDTWYTVTLTSARSPGPFLDAVDEVDALTMKQTQGAAPSVRLIDAFEVRDTHQGRVSPRAATNVLIHADDDSRLLPVVFQTTAPAYTDDSDAYGGAAGMNLYNGSATVGQEIEQRSGGGSVEYPWMTVYVRKFGNPTGDIDVTCGAATTTITDAEIEAAEEVFDGWRKIVHDWVPNEPVFDNSGTDLAVVFSTTGTSDIANRFELLSLASTVAGAGASTYGQADSALQIAGIDVAVSDLVLTMHTDVPAIVDFDSVVGTTPVTGMTAGAPCQVSEFEYALLSWDESTVAVAEFAWYEIQRKDTIDTTYRTVAKITDRARLLFADAEGRFAVASTYRMRACRVDGICSEWSAEETQTPTLNSTATADGCGLLAFSTNEYTAATVIFSESYDSDPTGVFRNVDADAYTFNRHYGRFGTQSFHPTERGGVSFERTLLVSDGTAATRADHEFDRLRDLAHYDVPYVCVRDDLGNRWFATVVVPDMSVRRPGDILLASVRVVESTEDPWPADNQFAL